MVTEKLITMVRTCSIMLDSVSMEILLTIRIVGNESFDFSTFKVSVVVLCFLLK